jgi:hypothetical protein
MCLDKLSNNFQMLCKDIISATLSKNGPSGGVEFHLTGDKFENQRLVHLLPKLLVVPFEVLIGMSTESLSENNKNCIVALLVDNCCRQFENFILQVT